MKMTVRLFLTTIILTMLAHSAYAKSVYKCSMTSFSRTGKDGVKLLEPEFFKFQVTATEVKFEKTGVYERLFEGDFYMGGRSMKIAKTFADGSFKAYEFIMGMPVSIAQFIPPTFYLSSMDILGTKSFIATCDDF